MFAGQIMPRSGLDAPRRLLTSRRSLVRAQYRPSANRLLVRRFVFDAPIACDRAARLCLSAPLAFEWLGNGSLTRVATGRARPSFPQPARMHHRLLAGPNAALTRPEASAT